MILSYVQEEAERAAECGRALATLREEREVLADKVPFTRGPVQRPHFLDLSVCSFLLFWSDRALF